MKHSANIEKHTEKRKNAPKHKKTQKNGTLGVPWALLGRSWAPLGHSWGPPGRSWGPLGRSWGALGALLGRSCPLLGHFWEALGGSWGALGGPFGHKNRSLIVICYKKNRLKKTREEKQRLEYKFRGVFGKGFWKGFGHLERPCKEPSFT